MDVLQPSLGTNKRHGVDFYTDSSGNMEKSSQGCYNRVQLDFADSHYNADIENELSSSSMEYCE